jgi:hypothetical protein
MIIFLQSNTSILLTMNMSTKIIFPAFMHSLPLTYLQINIIYNIIYLQFYRMWYFLDMKHGVSYVLQQRDQSKSSMYSTWGTLKTIALSYQWLFYKFKIRPPWLWYWHYWLVCILIYCTHLSIYGSTALCWALAALSVSWTFTQSVGFLWQGISPSQGHYLHTGHQKHRINAHRHPCLTAWTVWSANLLY